MSVDAAFQDSLRLAGYKEDRRLPLGQALCCVDLVGCDRIGADGARQFFTPTFPYLCRMERAVEEGRYRASQLQEQVRRRILEGIVRVETGGWAVGQVNGLTVLEVADYEFAIPARISSQTYMGRGNVVAIDREANLAGNIHSKGVLILQGYLGARYAQEKPLTLSASLTFEQNYDRIDGDSASSAELYAMLSSLSGLPIRQDLAVTGSVDQQGRVQAIGAVTVKIEGFFDICHARGLTGNQGVLIPVSNVRNVILRQDVVQAVREGAFHVYSVATVDEGIEVLTGVEAGAADAEGVYPEGSVNFLVHKRLLEMAEERDDKDEEDCGEDGTDADPADAEYADKARGNLDPLAPREKRAREACRKQAHCVPRAYWPGPGVDNAPLGGVYCVRYRREACV